MQIIDTIKNKKRGILLVLGLVVVAVIVVASVIVIKDEIVWRINQDSFAGDSIDHSKAVEDDDCNVAGIIFHGELVTYISSANLDADGNILVDQAASEDIVYAILQAQADDNIKAIVLEVDSYGGSPVGAEEIANALKAVSKPTVALIREGGVSAGYLAASGADIIFASKNSDVGSIGATMSYLDYVKQNEQEGLTYNQLSSGKFKDTGDPDKPLSLEEKKLLMRDINILHQNFVAAVAENRHLDTKEVERLADGSTMLGEMALENGLIDRIGGESEVLDYLAEITGGNVMICWY